jgi:hypothetical protein
MRSDRCLVLAVAALLQGPCVAHGAASFLPKEELTAADAVVTSSSAVLDGSGRATLAYLSGATGLDQITRPFAGSFASGPQVVAGAPVSPTLLGLGDGSALALWVDSGVVKAARRSAEADSFSPLPDLGAGLAFQAAAGPDGSVVVARYNPIGTGAASASILPAGANEFGASFDLNTPAGGVTTTVAALALSAQGAVLACYSEGIGVPFITSGAVSCRRRDSDGALTAPHQIAALSSPGFLPFFCAGSDSAASVAAAFDSGGTGHVGWGEIHTESTGTWPTCTTSSTYGVRSEQLDGTTWSTATPVTTGSSAASTALTTVAMGLDGQRAVFAVLTTNTATGVVSLTPYVVTADGAGVTQQAALHSGATGVDAPGQPQIAALGDGRLLLAFSHAGVVAGAERPSGADAAFATPVTLGDHGTQSIQGLQVTGDGAGDGLVTWRHGLLLPFEPQRAAVAIFDGGGPRMGAITGSAPKLGEPGSFTVDVQDNFSGPATVSWDFGDGSAASSSGDHTWTSAGTYTVRATGIDGLGNSRSASRTIVISAPTAPGGGGEGSGSGTSDTTAPTISTLSFAPAKFRVAAAPTALVAAKKRSPKGTKVTVAVSEPSLVVMHLARLVRGAPRGGKCKAGAKPSKGQRRCTARVSAGELNRAVAGTLTFAFSGRLGTKALKPGRYVMRATATDAAGNSSAAKSAAFRVVA